MNGCQFCKNYPLLKFDIFVLLLPSLDAIGHEFGPHTPKVIEHLIFLDDQLSSMIMSLEHISVVLVVGDHGCRWITDYFIELYEFNKTTPTIASIYQREGDLFKFRQEYNLDPHWLDQHSS